MHCYYSICIWEPPHQWGNHSGNSTGNILPVPEGGEGTQAHIISLFPGLGCLVQKSMTWTEKRTQDDTINVAGKTHSKYMFLTPLAKNKGQQSNSLQNQQEIPNNRDKMKGTGSYCQKPGESRSQNGGSRAPGSEIQEGQQHSPLLCVVCQGRGGVGWGLQRNQILPLPSVLFLTSIHNFRNQLRAEVGSQQGTALGKLSSLQEDTPVTRGGRKGLHSSAL